MRPAFFYAGINATRRMRSLSLLALTVLLFSASSVPAYTDIQQINSNDFRGLIKEGDKLVRRGEYLEAEKVFKRATEINPNHSGAKLKLAFVYVKQRRLRNAYELSYAVAKAEPKNSNAFAILGATLLSAGRFKEARAVYFNALRLNKREALAWAGYGMLDFYENRIFDSLGHLSEAVFHDSDEPDYYFSLAQVSARAERYQEAAEAYNRFLMLSMRYR